MNLSVRPLQSVEFDQFYEIFTQVIVEEFPEYSKNIVRYLLTKIYTKTNFLYWLDNDMKTILLCVNDGREIIGFAVIDEPYGGVSLCRWLGVLRKYQRKTAGSLLVAKWLENATLQGCHKAEVASQPGARMFYARMGMKEEGFRALSYFGSDQYLFGKILGKPQEKVIAK